jgi:hypothetical protein
VLGQRAIDRVDEEQIGLAGVETGLENALPQLAGIDLANDLAALRALEREHRAGAHRLHEFVGDVDAVVKIEALAVEIAGSFADFEELLDLGMMAVEIEGGPSRGAASPG